MNWSVTFLTAGLWWSAATAWALIIPPSVHTRRLSLWQSLLHDGLAGVLLGLLFARILR